MPSHLTRVVFRSIIADTPLICRGCAQRGPRLRTSLQHGVRAVAPQRRTFFGMLKSPRKVKPAEVPAGSDVMGDLIEAQQTKVRAPTPEKVAQAVDAYFLQKKPDLEDFHVARALNAFRYVLENPKEDGESWVPHTSLTTMMKKLEHHPPATGGAPHTALAKVLNAEITKGMKARDHPDSSLKTFSEYQALQLPVLVRVLCVYGASAEARDMVVEEYGQSLDELTNVEARIVRRIWKAILAGFAREKNTAELVKTTELMENASVPIGSNHLAILVRYFTEQKDLEKAKFWYSRPVHEQDNRSEFRGALAPLLEACVSVGDIAFGHQIVASLLQKTPDKETWDAIFVWSAAIGKGPDEIDRMMSVMVRKNQEERREKPETPLVEPDIATINALVKFSMSKQDSYSAERFVVLGENRGIFPNEKTYAMQMHYRLSTDDIDGARAAYYGLQGQISNDSECVEAVNRLVQVLCQVKPHQFDDIMAIVDDLLERRTELTPETVAAVCVLHLKRAEPHDAGDLLNLYAHHFSPAQRTVIRQGLASFVMDGQTTTADAWEAYQMLRSAFPETPRSDRIPLMKEFFKRERSDMACHVFFHMRNSAEEHIAADNEVYVQAFVGFARNADVESLELANNQLKIDLNVEMDTRLRNALMLAYAATGNHRRAMAMWAEIASSKEGPSYNSIAIAFRACEGTHFGEEHAHSIWQRLKQMDIDIDKEIFTAYLGAIARNHRHDDALALVEAVEEEYGFTPDLYILGNWFQCTANIDRQEKVEAWIKQHYPAVWTQLEALGSHVTANGLGYRQFNFNRDLEP